MSISEAVSICTKNEIKVYPVKRRNGWFLQVNFKGSLKTFEKRLDSNNAIGDAVQKTYLHYANKINIHS